MVTRSLAWKCVFSLLTTTLLTAPALAQQVVYVPGGTTHNVPTNYRSSDGSSANDFDGGDIYVRGFLINSATMNNIGWLQNDGDLSNESIFNNNVDPIGIASGISSTGLLQNSGQFNNNSRVENAGTLRNSGQFNNRGTLISNGTTENTGTLSNRGTFNNGGTLTNYQTLTNLGTWTNSATAQTDNRQRIDNRANWFNSGTLSNSGTITNGGNFTNDGTFQNSGRFENQQHFNNLGTLNSTGTIINGGVFEHKTGSVISSSIENSGQYINRASTGVSKFINTGSVYNYEIFGASLDNRGTIYNEGRLSSFEEGSTNTGRIENRGSFVINNDFNNHNTITNFGLMEIAGNLFNYAAIENHGTLTVGEKGFLGLDTENSRASLTGNIVVNGTLGVGHYNNDVNYDGNISGTGDLSFAGYNSNTRTILTGDSSAFDGRTNIYSGTLQLDGAVGGDVSVLYTATLSGGGRLQNVYVGDGGRLAPRHVSGPMYIGGDLTMDRNSIYEVDLDSFGHSDKLVVGGRLNLHNSIEVVALDPAGTYHDGQFYEILQYNADINSSPDAYRNLPIVLDSAFLKANLDVREGMVSLNVATANADSADSAKAGFAKAAKSTNQHAAAKVLENLHQSEETLALYNSLLMLNEAEASEAFSKLAGDSYATTRSGLATVSQAIGGSLNTRLALASFSPEQAEYAQLAYGGDDWAALSVPAGQGVSYWAHALGSRGTLDGNSHTASLDMSMGGMLFGGDAMLEDWRVGLMGGYSQAHFNSEARHSKEQSDGYHIGAYGGRAWDQLALRSGLIYSWHDLESERFILYPDHFSELDSEYNASVTQAFAELGYTIPQGDIEIEPFVNLSHLYMQTDSFTETGPETALQSDSDSSHLIYTTLGLHGRYAIEADDWNGMLNGTLGWQHAFGDITPSNRMALGNAGSFMVDGSPIAQNAALVGLGIGFNIAEDTSLSVNYQGQFASNMHNNGIMGQLRIGF